MTEDPAHTPLTEAEQAYYNQLDEDVTAGRVPTIGRGTRRDGSRVSDTGLDAVLRGRPGLGQSRATGRGRSPRRQVRLPEHRRGPDRLRREARHHRQRRHPRRRRGIPRHRLNHVRPTRCWGANGGDGHGEGPPPRLPVATAGPRPWCPGQDSNLRPSAPEADALSTELPGPATGLYQCGTRRPKPSRGPDRCLLRHPASEAVRSASSRVTGCAWVRGRCEGRGWQ